MQLEALLYSPAQLMIRLFQVVIRLYSKRFVLSSLGYAT